jgi:hypothetical protein
MPAVPKLVKMLGDAAWCVLGDNYQGRIERGLLRDGSELVIDLECEGRRYSARLERRGGDVFEGRWTHRGTADSGAVTATLYRSSAGELLFGEWWEDHTKYQWWAHLSVVEHFPDEPPTARRSP